MFGLRLLAADLYAAALRREFNSVGNQIFQNSGQTQSVAYAPVVRYIDFQLQLLILFLYKRRGHLSKLIEYPTLAEALLGSNNLAAFNSAHLKDVINERKKVSRCVAYCRKALSNLLNIVRLTYCKLGHSCNYVERRSYIVAHRRKKRRFCRVCLARRVKRRLQRAFLAFLRRNNICNVDAREKHKSSGHSVVGVAALFKANSAVFIVAAEGKLVKFLLPESFSDIVYGVAL